MNLHCRKWADGDALVFTHHAWITKNRLFGIACSSQPNREETKIGRFADVGEIGLNDPAGRCEIRCGIDHTHSRKVCNGLTLPISTCCRAEERDSIVGPPRQNGSATKW